LRASPARRASPSEKTRPSGCSSSSRAAFAASALARDQRSLLASAAAAPPSGGVAAPSTAPTKTATLARPFAVQFALVLTRAHLDYARNLELFASRVLVNTFLGLLFGLLFVRSDLTTFSGTQSGLGYIMSGVGFAAIIFLGSSVTVQFERRGAFYRERAARFYLALAYALSIVLVDVPYIALVEFLFVALAYWVGGLRASAASFFFFYLGALVLGVFFMAVGVALSALSPSLPVAQILSGLVISTTFLFAGLYTPAPQIPAGWKGLYYAVPSSHVLRALATNQFYCTGGASAGCPQISTVVDGVPTTVDRFAYVLAYLGLEGQEGTIPEYPFGEIGWAALAAAVVMLIAAAALQFVNYQRR
jgi:ABC-type multidrug transport system permease subunit